MKPRLCDHERERRRVAGVRRYEPTDIEIPPWPDPATREQTTESRWSASTRRQTLPPPELAGEPVQRCVADLRDYVRRWPVALGFGVWIVVEALTWVALGVCVYVGVLGIGALLGAAW